MDKNLNRRAFLGTTGAFIDESLISSPLSECAPSKGEKIKAVLVIVATKDSTHHEHIIKGLDMGCDVLSEKPLTTEEIKYQAVLDAGRRSKGKLIAGLKDLEPRTNRI